MKRQKGCSATVPDSTGFHFFPCSREGVVKERGKMWCRQHAPSLREKRRLERAANRKLTPFEAVAAENKKLREKVARLCAELDRVGLRFRKDALVRECKE